MGGTTYAALTARNMGARVGVHTSASYEPGLVDTLRGTYVARVPAEFTTCFTNEYRERSAPAIDRIGGGEADIRTGPARVAQPAGRARQPIVPGARRPGSSIVSRAR